MTRTYLDHASTSPLRPAARDTLVAWLGPILQSLLTSQATDVTIGGLASS